MEAVLLSHNIETDRQNKVRSLLTDTVEEEKAQLNDSLKKLKLSEEQLEEIEKTINFALSQNYGSHILYKYYVSHPLRVTKLCIDWMLETNDFHYEMINAAIVHNALEKNIISKEDLENNYGSWSLKVIDALTVDRERQKNDPTWADEYYSKLRSLDKYGQILKAFDKLDNIYALFLNPDEKVRTDYMSEIETHIKPIIDEHAPFISKYFEELIKTTRDLPHRPIDEVLNEIER